MSYSALPRSSIYNSEIVCPMYRLIGQCDYHTATDFCITTFLDRRTITYMIKGNDRLYPLLYPHPSSPISHLGQVQRHGMSRPFAPQPSANYGHPSIQGGEAPGNSCMPVYLPFHPAMFALSRSLTPER